MFADREPRWFCKIRMGFGLTERMISDLKIVIWKLVWKSFKSRGSREGRSFLRHSVDRELYTIDRMVRPTLLKNILQKSGTFHLKDWMTALIWQMCPLSACERASSKTSRQCEQHTFASKWTYSSRRTKIEQVNCTTDHLNREKWSSPAATDGWLEEFYPFCMRCKESHAPEDVWERQLFRKDWSDRSKHKNIGRTMRSRFVSCTSFCTDRHSRPGCVMAKKS